MLEESDYCNNILYRNVFPKQGVMIETNVKENRCEEEVEILTK